jgi:hypothetical protein
MHVSLGRAGNLLIVAGLGAAVVAAPGCSKGEKMVQGECHQVFGADVCTWGTMSGDQVVAFGATIPVKLAEAAPAEMPMVWPPKAEVTIPLPAEVKTATGFDNMNVFWEPHGHPPGPYLTPHFDFHFNTEDVSTIDCADTTKPAAAPAGYELPDVAIPQVGMLIGLCVPGMGMHSLLASELHSNTLFQKTMIVGFYHKAPIFIEPMITKETLMGQKTFSLDIPAVPGAPPSAHYPTKFSAVYDSTAQAYKFTFSDFAGMGTQ